MEEVIALDQEIFLYLNNLGSSGWDTFWNIVTNKYSSIPLYMLLVVLLYRSIGLNATILTLVVVAGLITATDQLANVFKDAFERSRPCGQEGVMENARFVAVRCGKFGYFSAHAASSAALAVFMGAILRPYYKNLIYVLIIWSVFVAYSRIYVGVHYPGDILTGALIGIILGYIFYRIQQFLVNRYEDPIFEAVGAVKAKVSQRFSYLSNR